LSRPDSARSGPLERYARILELLAAYPRGLTSADIEKILGLPKTSVNRLMNALEASDLVEVKGARNALFLLGDRLNRVLRAETAWIQIATQRCLKELAEDVGESCFIARKLGNAIESVAMKSPDASVGIYVTPGYELPCYASASGKLLWAMSHAPIDPARIERVTAATITDAAALADQFAEIRSRGFALERGEHVPGLATLAVPVETSEEPDILYGVGMTGPEDRIVSGKDEKIVLLRKAAQQLSAILSLRTTS
jgi:DNA-binding IclR family transcriptional regulator